MWGATLCSGILSECIKTLLYMLTLSAIGVRCSAVVRAFAHGLIGRRIDPLW